MTTSTRLTGYSRKSQELTLREMREAEREKKRRADEAAVAAAHVTAMQVVERDERIRNFRHEMWQRWNANRKLTP